MPEEVQRRRVKGFRLPPNTVSVTRPGVFGNPFNWRAAREAGYQGTDDELKALSVQIYREWVTNNARYGHGHDDQLEKLLKRLPELRGKNLACYCPIGKPCHRQVLLELANK